jgi:ATP-dependent DNA ligase
MSKFTRLRIRPATELRWRELARRIVAVPKAEIDNQGGGINRSDCCAPPFWPVTFVTLKIEKSRVGFIEPMLALAVTKLPEGPAWSYELKFDGYRALGVKAAGQVRLFSRNGKDLTQRFVSIARALEALPDDTVIDGEIIAYDTDGRPSFNVLQNRGVAGRELHLYIFDLLTLRGESLIPEPLETRRELLRTKVMPLLPDSIRRRWRHRRAN